MIHFSIQLKIKYDLVQCDISIVINNRSLIISYQIILYEFNKYFYKFNYIYSRLTLYTRMITFYDVPQSQIIFIFEFQIKTINVLCE